MGLPVVCLRLFGFGDVVDESCGVQVETGSVRSVIDGLAQALYRLWEHPEMVGQLSAGALGRAQSYSWDRLAERIKAVYEEALGVPPVSPAESDEAELQNAMALEEQRL